MSSPFTQQQKLIATITDFCDSATPILLISGVLGSGKSTLLEQYVQISADQENIIRIKATHEITAENILTSFAEHCDYTYHPESDDITVFLNHLLIKLQRCQQAFLCLIDDAHLLSKEALTILLRLAAMQAHGRVEMHLLLASEPVLSNQLIELAKQHGLAITIPTHILQPLTLTETQQYLQETDLTSDAIAQIQQLSGGIPSRINRVSQQFLLDQNKKIETTPTTSSTTGQVHSVKKHKVKVISLCLLTVVIIACWWWGKKPHYLSHPPLKLPPAHATKPFTINPTTVKTPKAAKQVAKQIVAAAPKTPPMTPLTLSEKRLHAFDGYTLQLIGVSKPKAMVDFIEKNKLKDKALYFKSQYKQKPWYVIVYGNYSSFNQAKDAIKKLPLALQKQHPWIRSLNSIHKAMVQ